MMFDAFSELALFKRNELAIDDAQDGSLFA
jgi:hypothetical protein